VSVGAWGAEEVQAGDEAAGCLTGMGVYVWVCVCVCVCVYVCVCVCVWQKFQWLPNCVGLFPKRALHK